MHTEGGIGNFGILCMKDNFDILVTLCMVQMALCHDLSGCLSNWVMPLPEGTTFVQSPLRELQTPLQNL